MRTESPEKSTPSETTSRAEITESGKPHVPEAADLIGEQSPAHARFHFDPIAFGAGALAAALGVAVLIGWHTGNLRLIEAYPGLAPMRYNAAVCFVALGSAVLALGLGSPVWARVGASAAGLLAFARLAEYVTGTPLGTDRLLLRFTLPGESFPVGPMPPNTAIAFVFLASAVLLLSWPRRFRGRCLAVALFGSAGIALGLNTFVGYLTGFHTFGWGQFQLMAAHTSVGLILLGASLLASSWRDNYADETSRSSWLLVVITMAGVVTSVSLWQALAFVERARDTSSAPLHSAMPETVLMAGLLLTALFGAAVYLAQMAWLRTHLAERTRRELQRENAERKRAEEELRRASAYNRSLIEASLDPLVTISPNGKITDVNRAAEDVTGYSRQELIGTDFSDYFTEPEKARRGYRQVFREGLVRDYELAIHRREGHVTPVLYNASVYQDEDGEVVGVFAAARDITERKQAEQRSQRANAYNRSLLETSLDPLVTIAPDGKITDVNRAAEEVTGYSRQELIGTDFSDYFADPEKARRGYQQVFREGLVQDYELAIHRRDGHVTPVLYNASVYRDERGEAVGVFAAARDITERKRAEEALEQNVKELARSNKDLEQFAYVASHDLQEPLRMVANFTQLLAKRYGGKLDSDADEFIGYAVDGARRMQTMIEDLLTYSRVGTRGKDFERVDCNEVLGRAVANLQIAIHENGAFVSHQELPTVLADGSQLLQLFQNLVANAIKFRGADAPRIHVSAAREGTDWLFAVRDNGIGIDPEYADRIFVIFQRLHSREEYPGTGIGLAVCKKIVERHRGKIWVESEPGKGATFFFTLPGV